MGVHIHLQITTTLADSKNQERQNMQRKCLKIERNFFGKNNKKAGKMSQDCNSYYLRQHMYKYPGWFRIMLIVLCFPVLIEKG